MMRRGTKVHVPSFDAIILNECCEGTAHRMTLREPWNVRRQKAFWVVMPNELINVLEYYPIGKG